LNHFDTRLTPDAAKLQLSAYKAQKNSTLAKVVADIQALAGRAATSFPEGTSRRSLFNMEAVSAFIKCLPPISSTQASNSYHTLSAKLGRAATFEEVSKAVSIWKNTIDVDIKTNGGEQAMHKASKNTFVSKHGKHHKQGAAKATGYTLSAGNTGSQASANVVTQASANVVNTGGNGAGKGSSNSHTKADGTKSGYKGRSFNPNHTHKPPQNGHYCSLCGNTDHVAINGCPFMTTDHGKNIKVNPTQGVCGKCPSSIMPRLNHNESICPYRPKGPLFGTAK
jgi:hypothetical protein